MKKYFTVLLIMIFFTPVMLFGQYRTTQAGLRLGYRSGIFCQFSNEAGNAEVAYNAMLGISNYGIQLTGLRIIYEKSLSTISPDLYFAWGYGGHIGFISDEQRFYPADRNYYQRRSLYPVLGIDGWLAAEYRVKEVPLNISLNVKPYIETRVPAFIHLMPFDLAISVSYVF